MSNNKHEMETMNDKRIATLRVAQAELSSGNVKEVFWRLSPGAVAFPMDRGMAKSMVSTELHQALLESSSSGTIKKKTT
jgi:hypothetical protein